MRKDKQKRAGIKSRSASESSFVKIHDVASPLSSCATARTLSLTAIKQGLSKSREIAAASDYKSLSVKPLIAFARAAPSTLMTL